MCERTEGLQVNPWKIEVTNVLTNEEASMQKRTETHLTGSPNPFYGIPLGSCGDASEEETCGRIFHKHTENFLYFLYWKLGFLLNFPPTHKLQSEHLCCSVISAFSLFVPSRNKSVCCGLIWTGDI